MFISMKALAFLWVSLRLYTTLADATPTISTNISSIEIIGNKFFDERTGGQFFIKGIAYQPGKDEKSLGEVGDAGAMKYIDPLADPNICLRDIPHLSKLNINTVRVYSVDPSKPHDICMSALAEAGIYVLLDLAEPDTSIVRENPSWDVRIWKRYTEVIDSMQKYPNLLGFFSGNEVTNDNTNTDASPFVKAAIRDIKQYISSNGYRKIPVGYSTNDDVDTRENLAEYFSCGENDAADFYGINMYEWCGYSSYGTSGYKERTIQFEDFPIPVFFSEFGCNLVRPRPFTEVGALYGTKMSKVWSGGLAYMYFEEENQYGVVDFDKYGNVIELEDFANLRNEFSKAKPVGINKSEYLKLKPKEHKRSCPKAPTKEWKASESIPHTPDSEKCECLEKHLPFVVEAFTYKDDYQYLFDELCSQINCNDTTANGELGIYGKFSDCTAEQKLALHISEVYFKRAHALPPRVLGTTNIRQNPRYRDSLQENSVCQNIVEHILDANQTPIVKDSTKGNRNSGSQKAIVEDIKSNIGSSSHLINSGCALLFSAIFISSFFL